MFTDMYIRATHCVPPVVATETASLLGLRTSVDCANVVANHIGAMIPRCPAVEPT